MRISIYILMLLLLCNFQKVIGQVNVNFIPEVYGTSINGLMNVTIFSTLPRNDVKLNINVSESKAGKVLTIQTGVFSLIQGTNRIPVNVVRNARILLTTNKIADYLRRNAIFPQGFYDYDFEIIAASSSGEIITDQTFSHDIVPPAPLDLIEPFDHDEICEKRPLLTWQPSMPAVAGMLYELQLSEIKENQNAVEALNYNLPIVNQRGIVANILVYPTVSKELIPGKKYAWQVTAYKDQTVINRSEIWQFTVNCKDSIANVVESEYGYRSIEDLNKGNYYVAEGYVKFAVVNSYQEQKLKYEITCITDVKSKVRSLPRVTLKRGQNKIRLDISRNSSFKDGYSYIMSAHMPNGTVKSLRFIYKDLE
ncbi:DUF928 domain-containing protein [Pedobacter rhodius]|uniref:DUF928 domain-containing protein n=1 Tax=Pedobacter rhodius TaxID=3004098 RepID=A0ABT4KUA0_9SPHI|nr:DUF928 domain-containing protein [Pedobacter sp. SJ11]MCZ4222504.1 DUF928 domain-containing protein [Pedobacter sp. SJ11]